MNQDSKPGFWRRLYLALVRTIFVVIFVGLLAVGGYFAVKEIRRSFDSVSARIELTRRDLDTLRSEVDRLEAAEPGKQESIAAARAGADSAASRLEAMSDEMAAMEDRLAALDENLSAATGSIETTTEDTAALGTALVALQSDLNEMNAQIDALGGEVDGLSIDTQRLDESVGLLSQSVISVTASVEDVTDFEETVALFHVWELVTRARLRLMEDNVGLARADLELAFRAVDAMMEESPAGAEETLTVAQTRLAFAFTSLPDNPTRAARDLDAAWEELGQLLAQRLLPESAFTSEAQPADVLPAETTEEAAPEAAPAATEEAAPTPEPTATPES